jgi:uncharacterized protein involved in exopolysaccharide biosynthesis
MSHPNPSPSPTTPSAGLPDLRWLEAIGAGRWIVRALQQQWKGVLGWTIITAFAGVALALVLPVTYQARTRLLPYRSAVSASGLSGLAGLAGVRLPAGVGDQTITPDLYPDVLTSADFQAEIATAPLWFGAAPRRQSVFAYEKARAAQRLFSLARLLPRSSGPTALPSDSALAGAIRDPDLQDFLRDFGDYLQVALDRKTSVVTITSTMPDAVAAADLARVTSAALMARLLEFEVKKTTEQLRFLTTQLEEARTRYNGTQRALADFSDRNRVLLSATGQVERERLSRANDLAFEVLQQISREVEQVRIKRNQDTPVFVTIERPVVPSRKNAPRRSLIVLAALVLGVFVGGVQAVRRTTLNQSVSS